MQSLLYKSSTAVGLKLRDMETIMFQFSPHYWLILQVNVTEILVYKSVKRKKKEKDIEMCSCWSDKQKVQRINYSNVDLPTDRLQQSLFLLLWLHAHTQVCFWKVKCVYIYSTHRTCIYLFECKITCVTECEERTGGGRIVYGP